MITKDNYEHFFFLYIDNELSMEEKLIVEKFVAENPDLQEEWEALLQCRIYPDEEVAYPDPAALLKEEGLIRMDNYESWLLSYIDGELSPSDRHLVEAFVRQHPAVSAELSTLQQTVSHPDVNCVFSDKDSLYRSEKRRVIFLPWMRVAAAAVICLGVAGWFFFPRHNAEPIAVVPTVAPAVPTPVAVTQPKEKDNKKVEPAVTPVNTATLYHTESKAQLPVSSVEDNNKQEIARVEDPTPANVTQVRPIENTEAATTAVSVSDLSSEKTGVVLVAQRDNISTTQSSFATQELQNPDHEDTEKEDDTPADNPPASSKQKLRGIFRKVSRVLGGTTGHTENGQREILIGAFQVAVK